MESCIGFVLDSVSCCGEAAESLSIGFLQELAENEPVCVQVQPYNYQYLRSGILHAGQACMPSISNISMWDPQHVLIDDSRQAQTFLCVSPQQMQLRLPQMYQLQWTCAMVCCKMIILNH